METTPLTGSGEVQDNNSRNYLKRSVAKVNKLLHNICNV